MVTQALRDAWKDPGLPVAQREIVDKELAQLRRGQRVRVFQVLVEAIREAGCDQERLLEVGCANGYYAEALEILLGRSVGYVGCDYSGAMIVEARARYPRHEFLVGDATALPFRDGACALVISGCVMLHVPEYERVIEKSARVSRRWVVFHRTPVCRGSTRRYTKLAYGVRCVEIWFGEAELQAKLAHSGLIVQREWLIGETDECQSKTILCRKQI
jgi:ubiquinone/menaquinone biosynthesis C-methylase UbiE